MAEVKPVTGWGVVIDGRQDARFMNDYFGGHGRIVKVETRVVSVIPKRRAKKKVRR